MIKQVTIDYKGDYLPIGFDINLSYSNNKIESGKITSPYITFFYTNVYVKYEGDKIIISSKIEGEENENDIIEEWFSYNSTWRLTYTMENGRAIHCLEEHLRSNKLDNNTKSIDFQYNNDGYLSKILDTTIGDNYKEAINLSYENGNLAKVSQTTTPSSGSSWIATFRFAPSKYENRNNYPIELYLMAAGFAKDGEATYLYPAYLGIFGKTSTYYPQLLKETYIDDNQDYVNMNISYEFDNNNNIQKTVWDMGDGSKINTKITY